MSDFLKAAEAGDINTDERSKTSALAKWGVAMSEGFVFVPRALMRHQAELELDSVAVMVLLNLIGSWWEEGDLPYPRPTTIAKRIGVHVRTVQRHLSELDERGLIARVRSSGNGSKSDTTVTRYDLSGLVHALQKAAVPTGAKIKNLDGAVVLPSQVI